MQVAQTFAKNRLGKRLLKDEKFYTAQKSKKIHAQWRGSFLSLPLTVGLLLTVKNQVIHICHELVHRHCTSLLFSIFILIIHLHLKVCKAVIVIFL